MKPDLAKLLSGADHSYCISPSKPVQAVGPPASQQQAPLVAGPEVITLSSDDEEETRNRVYADAVVEPPITQIKEENCIIYSKIPSYLETLDIKTEVGCNEVFDNEGDRDADTQEDGKMNKKKITVSDYFTRKQPQSSYPSPVTIDTFEEVIVKEESPDRSSLLTCGTPVNIVASRLMTPSVKSMLSPNVPHYSPSDEVTELSLEEVDDRNIESASTIRTPTDAEKFPSKATSKTYKIPQKIKKEQFSEGNNSKMITKNNAMKFKVKRIVPNAAPKFVSVAQVESEVSNSTEVAAAITDEKLSLVSNNGAKIIEDSLTLKSLFVTSEIKNTDVPHEADTVGTTAAAKSPIAASTTSAVADRSSTTSSFSSATSPATSYYGMTSSDHSFEASSATANQASGTKRKRANSQSRISVGPKSSRKCHSLNSSSESSSDSETGRVSRRQYRKRDRSSSLESPPPAPRSKSRTVKVIKR